MEVGRVGDDENVCPVSWSACLYVLCFVSCVFSIFKVPSAKEFYSDLSSLHLITSHGPVRSYCWKRLGLLEAKYRVYLLWDCLIVSCILIRNVTDSNGIICYCTCWSVCKPRNM